MYKQEIITALGLLSLLMTMVHLNSEPPLPHQDFNEPELEFSELEIEENVQKDTVSEDYPRSLKSNREKWLEKYGMHLHPQSNKSFAFR
jgi:hypothetical protein